MTRDVVALLATAPDVHDVAAALLAAGERFRLRSAADGAVVQLCDDQGRPLVSVEVPVLVRVPGEVGRLLGDQAAAAPPPPLWWVETRAPSAREGAERLGRRFAETLAVRCGGIVWPPEGGP
ncbi:MAG TPA: hypothetical protein VFC13_05700 [Actinomycetes bacterium]|nr:hypothetical protein [Actinomycetes bacterium]